MAKEKEIVKPEEQEVEPTQEPAPDPAKPEDKPAEREDKFTPEQQKIFDSTVKTKAEKLYLQKLRELGFEKPEDLDAAIKAQKEREEAEKTELQKAQERAEKAEKEKADALASVASAKRENEIIQTASKLEFNDPKDAIALVGEKVEDIEAELKKLAEEKPYLLKTKTRPNQNPGKPGNQGQPEDRMERRKRLGI